MKYSYPKLSPLDFGYFRLSGPGLANCMFIAARAYVHSIRFGSLFIEPTWPKLSIGPILRRERDSRFYGGVFKELGLRGFKKLLLLVRAKLLYSKDIQVFDNLGNFFEDLNDFADDVRAYFRNITKECYIREFPDGLQSTVAVHIRLGDFLPHMRISLDWVEAIILQIQHKIPNQQFLIFSDGHDTELRQLLSIQGVQRVQLSSAYAEMLAISQCKALIASDSTFSAWGAWLGKVPVIFSKRSFPALYNGEIPEIVLGESTVIPNEFYNHIC